MDEGPAARRSRGGDGGTADDGGSVGPSKAFHLLRPGERARYPDYLLPIAGLLVPNDEDFADAREQLLLEHTLQTARAYRADLDDVYAWAVRRGFDIRDLSDKQLRQYAALLRRRHFSESTIRRRRTAYRRLQAQGG
jgi:Phage integrase, N-terminal SAM-like domain